MGSAATQSGKRPRASKRASHPKVALLIETSNSYARGLLEGIAAYFREHRGWSIYLAEHGRGDRAPPWLKGWDGDGIIARIENASIERAVVASKLPVIDVSAARLLKNVPWVETDDRAIAQMAAAHFLERGFRHFAFSGLGRFNWSIWRCGHFRDAVTSAGYSCDVHQTAGHSNGAHAAPPHNEKEASWEAQIRSLVAWLRRLPKPVGVFACYDIRGLQVLEACRRAGIRVPDEVAVLGVDNDRLLCDLAEPPLSSVIPDTHRTGYQAAELLDRMMSGKQVSREAVLIPPLGIATRKSTDVLATGDLLLQNAVQYLREHAFEGIAVKDMLDEVAVSRRALEARFKRVLGRTPHEELVRLRVERAKELLRETDLPLKSIAYRIGARHVEYLSVMFRRAAGETPGDYRRRAARDRRNSPSLDSISSPLRPDSDSN
jgi:LacI family transcriptional regulator